MTDRDRLDEFRGGSIEAFEALFHMHQASVYRWVLRVVRDPATAEDLTVESFWRMYRAHARFDAACGFEPWARRIATHAALDWMRSQKRTYGLSVEDAAQIPAAERGDPAIAAEMRTKTATAFLRLPAKLRIAAMLVVVEGMEYKQAADALGISLTATKVRVFRALRLLRKDLEREGMRP
ncbi:MAG: RNA polymerase sigma factor [Terracidiphilus sp.]|nr:RNA polymerase sigma factor [Terracidiphilus sp.]